MQKRSFFLVVAATIVLVAAAAWTLAVGDRAVSRPPAARRAFPELAAQLGDLAWIRLTHGAETTDLNLIAGHWAVVEKGNYPAAAGAVRRLLLGLAGLTLAEPKTDRPALFGRLGLDDPSNGTSTLVALQDRTGNTVARLIVGKAARAGVGGDAGGVYVRRPGRNRTWLARGALDLPGSAIGWLDRRILDIADTRVASIVLTSGDGTALALQRAAAGGPFAVKNAPADAKLKDQAALAAPAAALADLDLDDVKPSAELPPPQSGVATAAFATFDGLTLEIRLFAHGKADWVAVTASGSGAAAPEAAALNKKLGRWVYAIPADRAKLLRTRLADLVEPRKGS